MKFSLIVPSRSRPAEFAASVETVFGLASDPASVEVVVRLDADDPVLPEYLVQHSGRWGAGLVFIIGPRQNGYASLPWFMDQAAAVSRGDYLFCWNDDMHLQTPGWDALYASALSGRQLAVAIGELALPGGASGDQCQYACAVIPRPLYKVCGGLDLGSPDLDRVWAALARHAQCEVRVPVKITHRQNFVHTPDTYTSREAFLGQVHRDWAARSAQWDTLGRIFAEKARRALES